MKTLQTKDSETPLRIDLKLRLHTNIDSNSGNLKSKKVDTTCNELETQTYQEPLLSDRTRNINQFSLTTKESLLPGLTKNSNIKSYLRIKPNKNVAFMPFEVYNNQTIVCDRAVYKFDHIFQPEAQQGKIFEIVGKEVTQKFIEGYNSTIFAYGSTGSGKTYTMFGNDDGLVPEVVQQIFNNLNPNDRLSCSMLQIYKENLIDLLGQHEQELKIKDINNSYVIQNLTMQEIKSKWEALEVIKKGNNLKKIRQTQLNQSSSRSHIVFTFYLEKMDSEGRPIKAKFNLVDLAGSQKVFKSKVEGEGLQEAKKINLSLSCLGNTISALVKNSDHIPYRESKLTRILKQSLMGNSMTRLIVTCSVNQEALEETISSIKFAQRAQKVQTQAQVAYNINKFKGEKEEKQKLVRRALQSAESKLNQIQEKVQQNRGQCSVCQDIRVILKRRDSTPQEIFNFNPLNSYFSPKAKIDLKTYSTNPVSRFSSVPRKQTQKNSSVKKNLAYTPFDEVETKNCENKKIFELRTENEKLKSDKKQLETRVKMLEQKMMKDLKDIKPDRGGKRFIKLGNAQKISKMKQNEPNASNMPVKTKSLMPQEMKTDTSAIISDQKHSTFSLHFKQAEQTNDLRTVLAQLNQAIEKFERATEDYRHIISPFQTDVLMQQIQYLESSLGKKKTILSPHSQSSTTGQVLNMYSKLKRVLCMFYGDVCQLLHKIFKSIPVESKEQCSVFLHEKDKQISSIMLTLKQCLEDNDDLQQLHNLLQKSKFAIKEQEKQKQYEPIKTVQNYMESSYNQFLNIKPSGFEII